jgi:hypothetical protein
MGGETIPGYDMCVQVQRFCRLAESDDGEKMNMEGIRNVV